MESLDSEEIPAIASHKDTNWKKKIRWPDFHEADSLKIFFSESKTPTFVLKIKERRKTLSERNSLKRADDHHQFKSASCVNKIAK